MKLQRGILKAYNNEENKAYELIKLYEYDNESLLDRLIVDREEGTDYLNILFRSENPEQSAYVVNTIGDEFIGFYNSISTKRTVESAGRLDTLAQAKKREIDDKNAKLQKYKASFLAPDIADRSKGALAILAEVTTRRSIEESKLNQLRGQLESINTQLSNLGSATPVSNSAGSNNAELLSLQNKNRELSVELSRKGGNDPEIQKQINDNQKRIQQIQPSSPGGGGTDRNEIKKKREDLLAQKINTENDIAAQMKTMTSLNNEANTYSEMAKNGAGADVMVKSMESEIELDNKQYEMMLGKLQNANDVNVAPDINFKQTLLGQPGVKPESTNRKVIIGLSAFGALIISALSIITLDFIDHSLRAPSIFNKNVHIPLLTVINKIDLKTKGLADYFNFSQEGWALQDNQFVENLRKLRYEIETSGRKVILFTSTQPGEGKTVIMEALAHSFSLSKKKVLLIDTNFSNNTLTQIFDAKPVLEQFSFDNERNAMEKFMSAVSMTKIPHVDIIGCKDGNYSPAEILPKNNLLDNLQQLARDYDYVLLEGAALNFHADSKELSKYADAIISVFSASTTIKEADKDSIKFLRSTHDKLLGAVLNKIDKDNIDL
jgi:Mrp family chromosome partitioning ATPase/capsular polysaccharide biosynthesis protein